jgi:predicted nucleic acid-binding protein
MNSSISTGVIMSYVSLLEVAHYLRKLPEVEFSRKIKSIQDLSTLTLYNLDAQTSKLALELLREYSIKGLGARDCIIIATMRHAGIKTIVTHDRAFNEVEDLTVIDDIPFREPHSKNRSSD